MQAVRGIVLGSLLLAGCGAPSLPPTTSGEGTIQARDLEAVGRLVDREARDGFDAYDANHDGILARAEVPFLSASTFQQLDADGDGRITWAEGGPTQAQRGMQRAMAFKVLSALYHRLATHQAQGLDLPAPEGTDFATFVDGLSQARSDLPTPQGPSDRPAVVLVPGWFLPTAIWIPLQRQLAARGWTHQITVPHFPSFGDIRDYAAAAAFRAQRVMAEAHASQVDLIGHSMGGLVLRYYLKNLGGDAFARHYVSFGTPQHGTVIGHLWPCTSTDQMLPTSDFLAQLNAGDETPGPAAYTSIRTNTDEIVLSTTSPILAGAANFLVPDAEHLELVWDPRAQAIAFDALEK